MADFQRLVMSVKIADIEPFKHLLDVLVECVDALPPKVVDAMWLIAESAKETPDVKE